MYLVAFRVRNYRSIGDSGWVTLSPDGISALIGQNEAGKTNILDALYAFYDGGISQDDLRSDGTLPEVACCLRLSSVPSKMFEDLSISSDLDQAVQSQELRVTLVRVWNSALEASQVTLDEGQGLLEHCSNPGRGDGEPPEYATPDEFAGAVFDAAPKFVLFDERHSLLPSQIDMTEASQADSTLEGFQAVQNFLNVAKLDIEQLEKTTVDRVVRKMLEDAGELITTEFRAFWTQEVGKSSQVSFSCERRCYDNSCPRPGAAYLEFFVKDNNEELHLNQRSRGMQWFLSFFLQLQASAIDRQEYGTPSVFLIDEPGATLHAKAQRDVLKMLESIRRDVQILYTTHSPFLLNVEEPGRILVVERADEDARNATLIRTCHEFGAASRDSLLPLYAAIGADLSHQQVVHKRHNVILEEISALHYLKAMWILARESSPVHFIPATGVANVRVYCGLLTAWDLDFAVLLDNDPAGTKMTRNLRQSLFAGRPEEAKKRLLQLPVQGSIEDLFSPGDFEAKVLEKQMPDKQESNSHYVKNGRVSKALLAHGFYARVASGALAIDDFDEATQKNMMETVARTVEAIA